MFKSAAPALNRRWRGRRWRFALAACAGILALQASRPAHAEVYYTVRDLLAEQFKASARVSFVKAHPSAAQRKLIEQRLGHALAKPDYVIYVAKTGEQVDGYALFDEERGQHELISFATFFNRDGAVTRVEVVAYREPFGDGVRAERFRRQFVGRLADSGYVLGRDVDAISGATISSRSLCRGVQRAALLLRELVLNAPVAAAVAAGGPAPAP